MQCPGLLTLLRHFAPSAEECLRLGLPPGWRPEEDQIARHRLGTLAWMVASGSLDVRIALPLDHTGQPYQPGRYGALYHPKAGLLYDSAGNIICFQGSVNETGAAWMRNREKFDIHRSWYSEQDREDIDTERQEFERIWHGSDTGLLVLPLPQAVNVRGPVIELTRIAVTHGAPDFSKAHVPPVWTPLRWTNFVTHVQQSGPGLRLVLRDLTGAQAEACSPFLARQTPLAVYMFRHTRSTLRAYQERGMVRGLATRTPEDLPVEFHTVSERALYEQIDELCHQFYRLADVLPEERSGVGFLMAVFRKRLASSFYALRRSLERRRDLILAIQHDLDTLDEYLEATHRMLEEDEDDDEDELDVGSMLAGEQQRLLRLYRDPERRTQLEHERIYLQEYITDLGQVAVDSKFEVFAQRLQQVLDAGHRVIVFTQYLDTLDFIRERLVVRHGQRLACYSGRGGEVWDPGMNAWRVVDKAEVKARSRQDHPQAIAILLGTDAASEGLNLQQFSALFNYDLPWNPMRVEQRIGRIDRIGQEAESVKIVNLYVTHTIEEDTDQTLRDRIHLFEEVVGPLQPILAEMPRIFRRVARGELELAEARRLLDEADREKPRVAIAALEEYVREEPALPHGALSADSTATQAQLAGEGFED